MMALQSQQRAAPDPGWVQSALPSNQRFAFGETGGSGAARDASRHRLKKPELCSHFLEALK